MRPLFALAAIVCFSALSQPASAQSDIDQRAEAQAAYLAGDYVGAQAMFESLLQERPGDADLLRRLANVQAARGNLAEAMQTIDRALAIAPADLDIQLARANILSWLGRPLEARRQADAIAHVRADYPGLSETFAAIGRLEKEDRIRLFSASIGGSASRVRFPGRGSETWTTTNASIAVALAPRVRAAFEADREDRRPVDTRLATRLDLLHTGGSAYVGGSVTPNADFRESWSISAGAEQLIGQGTTLLLDARYASYRFDETGVLGLGVRQTVGRDLSATVRTIHLTGSGEGYRFGASLRVDYAPEDRTGWFVTGASYPDTEADGTAQVRALSVGTAVPLSESLHAAPRNRLRKARAQLPAHHVYIGPRLAVRFAMNSAWAIIYLSMGAAIAVSAFFAILLGRRWMQEARQTSDRAKLSAITRSYLQRIGGFLQDQPGMTWPTELRIAAVGHLHLLLRGGERQRLMQLAEFDGLLDTTLRQSHDRAGRPPDRRN